MDPYSESGPNGDTLAEPNLALSVVVTTYEKPRDLERVLAGFRRQSRRDFEVLVCDDGSGQPTRDIVERFKASAPFPVVHCWQQNAGFRAARSRNNGVRAARGHSVVFVDGDCVPWDDFLERHAEAVKPGTFLVGERYLLEQAEADLVTVDSVASGAAFTSPPAREVKRVRATARKDVFYRLTGLKPDRPRFMTANASVALDDLRLVNGLDQRFEGWGHEDEDLRRRLVQRGRKPASVVGRANCLHLWHPADKSFLGKRKLSPNWGYFTRGFGLSRCRFGLVDRPLSDVSALVTSADADLAARARELLGLGAAPASGGDGARLEVEVLVDAGPPSRIARPTGHAEVSVLVSAQPLADLAARLPKGVQVVLAPDAPACGGQLPKEERPPVPTDLAKRGVKALRPLPAGSGSRPLDEAALRAASAHLDALL